MSPVLAREWFAPEPLHHRRSENRLLAPRLTAPVDLGCRPAFAGQRSARSPSEGRSPGESRRPIPVFPHARTAQRANRSPRPRANDWPVGPTYAVSLPRLPGLRPSLGEPWAFGPTHVRPRSGRNGPRGWNGPRGSTLGARRGGAAMTVLVNLGCRPAFADQRPAGSPSEGRSPGKSRRPIPVFPHARTAQRANRSPRPGEWLARLGEMCKSCVEQDWRGLVFRRWV